MTCIQWIYPPYFTDKSLSKLPYRLLKKEKEGFGGLPNNFAYVTTKLGNLDWKEWPNNFAQATTILGNLYWKHCLLIKNVDEIHEIEVFRGSNLNFTIRIFTWGLANDDNIYKKIFCSVWSIMQQTEIKNIKSVMAVKWESITFNWKSVAPQF